MSDELSTPDQDREYERIRDLVFPVIKTAIGCEAVKALSSDCDHGNCACARAASNAAGKLVWG